MSKESIDAMKQAVEPEWYVHIECKYVVSAREWEGYLMTQDEYVPLFTHPVPATESAKPSGEREALINSILISLTEYHHTGHVRGLLGKAADMLAADAQEIERVTEIAQTEKYLADMHYAEKVELKARLAYEARKNFD